MYSAAVASYLGRKIFIMSVGILAVTEVVFIYRSEGVVVHQRQGYQSNILVPTFCDIGKFS